MFLRIRRAIDEKDEGFTLIELLVVVIIIGILAAIAIPIFLNQRRSAVTAGVESDVRNIATNVETAATANRGVYPPSASVTGLASGSGIVTVSGNGVQKSADNTTFTYAVNGNNFVVCGSNPDSTAAGPTYINYVANLGGMQAPAASCPPA